MSLAFAFAFFSACSSQEQSNCDCKVDEDCEPGFLCDTELCECYRDYNCTRDEQCSDLGPCMECRNFFCTSYACESDEDCESVDGYMYCDYYDSEIGCRRCVYGGPCDISACRDPNNPLYVECSDEETLKCINNACICRPPCGGSCPDGQYCCRQTQTCDPIPNPCWEVECPPGEQVNPDPGGTLDEEICRIEGADCSCKPIHVCNPPCPDGSECADLDGLCEPECVLPNGKLACSDDTHCPIGGACMPDETCSYGQCSCIDDAACPPGYICVDEDGSCGICVPRGYYECVQDSDCLAAIVISRCCSLPMPRNVTTVESTPCLVEFPHEGPPPAGCEPDCSCNGMGQTNHCWPLPVEPLVVTCNGGRCRIDPEPGP